jgi:DinB superfamily
MKKSAIDAYPQFFDRYINQAPDLEVKTAVKNSLQTLEKQDWEKWEALADRGYAPGKWTGKALLQHMIDTERILTYRALCIARGEQANLPGFDEDSYAQHSNPAHRAFTDLKEEFVLVRKASIMLFDSFTDEMLLRKGSANGKTISPLALGFVVVGHEIHHYKILEERYFPVLNTPV